jgi:N-acetyl sugar amidotransferase
MIRCTECLYPSTKPDLYFENGVCAACRSTAKRKDVDWEARKDELVALLEKHRKPGRYDCIVPSSGGKDSHWQVLRLIELGARPLVVTAATCHLTDIGRANIDNLARYATTIEVSPNKSVRARLNRLGLQLVGDISYPEHLSIFTTPFRVACDMGIPLIFYGECPQEAYGGPPGTEQAKEMTLRWVQEFGGLLGLRPSDMIGRDGLTEADLADYMAPSMDRVRATGVTAYFLGQFFEWDSRRNAEVAKAAGMQFRLPSMASWWDFENLDNAQTGIHDYFGYLKYGYGRLAAQLSVDIRMGLISRNEAEKIAADRDGLYPDEYMGVPLEEILGRIGMTKAEFDAICARFTDKAIHC